jgi:hypothetical protein
MSLKRFFLTLVKIFLLLVVTAMLKFQMPELRYDFGTKEPVQIQSVQELSAEKFDQSTFARVRGEIDLTRAATFATHGVRYTYFLLREYGPKLVVRTPEEADEEWKKIDFHVGRLRPYHRMPFSRSVRAGFRKLFDVGIPEDAFFLARDDVPQASGWSIAALVLPLILWCVLAYFFFIHGRIRTARNKRNVKHADGSEHETSVLRTED